MDSKYYIGHTTDEKERHKASSGGIGSALIRYLLSLPEFGTGLTFVFNQKACHYDAKLIYSASEINVWRFIPLEKDFKCFVLGSLK